MSGRLKVWAPAEDLLLADLNNEFDHIWDFLSGIGGSSIADGSITSSKLDSGADPGVYFGEIFNDEIVTTGLNYTSATGLNVTFASGTAYILKTSTSPTRLVRVSKTSTSSLTLPQSATTYVDLKSDGTFTTTSSATVTTDATRLWSFTTDASSVTANTDMRDLTFLSTVGGASASRRYVDNVSWYTASTSTATVKSGSHFTAVGTTRTYTFASDQTVDITATGANGRDQGAEGSNTWYALVAIADSAGVNATKAMLVTAANYPSSQVLPTGYDHYKRIGWIRNDGSSNFLGGIYHEGKFQFHDHQSVLSGGSSGSYAAVSCSSVVPPTVREASFFFYWSGWTGAADFYIRTTGSGAGTGIRLSEHEYGVVFDTIMNTSQQFDYKVSNHSANILAFAFVDNLEKDS